MRGTEEEAAESEERVGSQVLAALEFAAFQPISGRRDTDVHHVVAERLTGVSSEVDAPSQSSQAALDPLQD